MKKFKDYYMTIIFMAIIIVINVVAVGLYISNMNKEIAGQTEERLTESMQEASVCVELKIEETIHELEMTAYYIGLEDYTSESVLANIKKMTLYAGFGRFDIVGGNGIGMETEGSVDYTDVKSYKKAMEGSVAILDVKNDEGKVCAIKFFVPIRTGERKVSGVYVTECGLDEFVKILDLDSINSKGKTFVVKSDGTVLSRKSDSSNENISDILDNEEQVKKLKSHMKSKKSGVLGFENGGNDRYVCYAATDYNGWKIVMLVSSSSVDANINDVTDNFVALGVFIGVMLVMLSGYFIYNIIVVRSVNAMNLRRYYMVSKYTEDIIVDYSCVKDSLYSNENWEKNFGYQLPKENVKECMTKHVAADDKEMFVEKLKDLQGKQEMVQFQCKMIDSENRVVNCKCKFFGIKNRMNKLIKVVGVIERNI